MRLDDARVLLTGACGGIGREIARGLAEAGAHVALAGRELRVLQDLANEVDKHGRTASTITADLSRPDGPALIQQQALADLGRIDVLVNNAGVLDFSALPAQSTEAIERIYRINVIGPVLLTRALLPHMLERGSGQIVNVGSIFGSIAFAYFGAYSSSKFALRGFSEALRRELAGSGVIVTYVAPRATRTGLNTPAVFRMCETLGMAMDAPQTVAAHVLRAMERDANDVYLGWPERLFVRVNAVLPRLVDLVLRRQNRQMGAFAAQPR